MTRRTALACYTALALVWAAPAAAQPSAEWLTRMGVAPSTRAQEAAAQRFILDTVEQSKKPATLSEFTQIPSTGNKAHGLPPIGRMDGVTILPTTPIATVVEYDPGGYIAKHDARWRLIAAQNGPVQIVGMCSSACTLVTVHVPKERLCFGENGTLNFHMPRLASDDKPSLAHARWMFAVYPDDIRGWLNAKGGPDKLPYDGYWKLPASELWKMGYRRCAN